VARRDFDAIALRFMYTAGSTPWTLREESATVEKFCCAAIVNRGAYVNRASGPIRDVLAKFSAMEAARIREDASDQLCDGAPTRA